MALLALAPAASAAPPCWKQLINDWYYDSRVDRAYPARCYQQAIDHLPEDAADYSNAADELSRALQAALTGGGPGGSSGGPDTIVPPTRGETRSTDNSPYTKPPDEGGNDGWLGALRPTNADSIPLPLLILAGLAMLLLAAAAVSFVARRVQARSAPAKAPPGARRPSR